jgi:hypothetical protein
MIDNFQMFQNFQEFEDFPENYKLRSILVSSASASNWERCMSTVAPTTWELLCCSDKAQVVLSNAFCFDASTNSASPNCDGFPAQELHAEAEEA